MLTAVAPSAKGQDIHFSQFDANPALFNPAYVGFFDGNGRFGLVYRNQWASVSQPFQTFAATAEWALTRNRKHRNGLNVGLIFDSDRAGSLSYGITSVSGVVSFFQAVGDRGSTLLSAALLVGAGQSGYDDRNADLYDPAERLEAPMVGFGKVGCGVALYHQFLDELNVKVGLSANNLNRPSISYLETEGVVLYPHFTTYVRGEYRVVESLSVMPLVAWQKQNQYNELVYGADVKWYIDESYGRHLAFSAGANFRHGDALMVNLAAEYNAMVITFSYDANVSYLATASHTIGAFEVGMVYRYSRQARSKKAISCPIF